MIDKPFLRHPEAGWNSPEVKDGSVALGRPWHPTTTWEDGSRAADPLAVGSAAFIGCYMDSHISREGWTDMPGRDKEGHTVWFHAKDSLFCEYGNTGPGANRCTGSVHLLAEGEERRYTAANVFGGRVPERTGS